MTSLEDAATVVNFVHARIVLLVSNARTVVIVAIVVAAIVAAMGAMGAVAVSAEKILK